MSRKDVIMYPLELDEVITMATSYLRHDPRVSQSNRGITVSYTQGQAWTEFTDSVGHTYRVIVENITR